MPRPALLLFLLSLVLFAPCHAAPLTPPQTPQSPPVPATAAKGAITAVVLLPDRTPMPNGVALVYDAALGPPPSLGKYWRIPDEISSLGNGGSLEVKLLPGTYFLQVAQKDPGAEIGPSSRNDFIHFHADAKGEPLPIRVEAGKTVDLGTLQAKLSSTGKLHRDHAVTRVEGIVTDPEGKPVEGAAVFAYLTPEFPRRPTFASEKTDRSGKFFLPLVEGTYYLRVRSVYAGGPPQIGEYQSVAKEFQALRVEIGRGEQRKGIVLRAARFTRPAGGADRNRPQPEKRWKNLNQLKGE